MVKLLSESDRAALEDAVHAAERQTSAELAVVVARASDAYSEVALAFGLVIGCLVALGLWHEAKLTDFPRLMFVELIACALVLILPPLRHLSLSMVPKRYMKHRAAQRAADEYLRLTHHLPASAPIVLIYISLAERYVHIYASRFVREKITDTEWDAVVAILTESVKSHGIAKGIINAVEHASDMLKVIFPDTGAKHTVPNVIEIIS
jgi:putative membrane protein